MKRNIFTIQALSVALTALSLASCTDSTMDDINKDKNHPMNAPAKYIVTDLLTSTAFNIVGGDFSLYASVYIEHETGTHNQLYNAEIRIGEPSVSTTYNNAWNSIYSNIMYAKQIIAKCSTGGAEEGNNVTLGVGKLLLAYNGALIADLFGDSPYTEAGVTNPDGTLKFMQPRIDKQEDIYKDVMKLVDEAIGLFDQTDAAGTGGMGSQDFIYGGNAAKWKKAAYALKARYTMRLLGRSTNGIADLQTVLDCASKSFTSAADECKFAIYDGNNNVNPLAGFYYSRTALGASKSLLDKFVARNDPRASQYFSTPDPATINTAPNGEPTQSQGKYDISWACVSWSSPTQLMSYHELLFLKAEAECRLHKLADAEATLRQAIAAGFANQANTINDAGEIEADLGPAVAKSYFDTSVKPLFDADPLKETMIQKYLSLAGACGEAVEAYSDYRRLQGMGDHFIELANKANASKFPFRFTYGSSDVTTNIAIKDAFGDGSYVYTEKVWWAGGKR